MTTIDKLRTLLTDLDGLLLLDEQNRRYATRLHTSAGASLYHGTGCLFSHRLPLY